MKKYGESIGSKNGYTLYPLLEFHDDGSAIITCYVIVDANDDVVGVYQDKDQAKQALEDLGNDEDMSPSFP